MKTSAITSGFSFTLKGLFYVFIFISYFASAQTSVMVNYSTSTAAMPNPERGFYRHNETHSSGYTNLDQSTLNAYRGNNVTLLLRLFYLEGFVSGPISSTYLSAIQSDFSKIRTAGLKCIVRFAYSDNTNGTLDAPLSVVLNHIAQLKPILASNADIISVVQAGFVGSWGEWYYTSNFGQNPTAADFANRKQVTDAILAALPTKMIQIRTPSLKQKTYNSTTALTASLQAFDGSNIARVGHHNDCFLASSSDFGTYNNTGTEYPYLAQETKYTPMGGETCAVDEPRSGCTSALKEMQLFHWSFMNLDYNPDVISNFQSETCFSDIQNGLGYRFELVSALFPKSVTGSTIPITLNIKNSGFSSLYNQRTVYLVLRNSSTGKEYPVALKTDPRLWAGGAQQTITENVTIPTSIPTGDYKLYLNLPDSDSALAKRPEYSIQMANSNIWESTTGYNNLLYTINIPSLGLDDLNSNKLNLVIYAVPGVDEMIVEMEGINEYKVSVFNILGQKINVDFSATSNKMILDTQSLSNGVYFLQFQNDKTKETRKILVSH